ncbi:hypothetical protein HHL22_15705 [Hymenobacter sp. RP-2-7]|uniref:Uncharacterized protein n=1 Tax=Hymenobacter polaris TaxID=2682546 RepID=A0A7Y0AG09_9BACT|nr:hypothetical protein [Hymenobacter polaris]NML66652.1 hypothetical protein [Hymenobacter polaris]
MKQINYTGQVWICFFGMNRSLSKTQASIQQNILDPLIKLGWRYHTLAAFMHINGNFSNRHSGEENVSIEVNGHEKLGINLYKHIKQDLFDYSFDWDSVNTHGDAWGDDFQSTKNLCRALHSLEKVTEFWHGQAGPNDLFIYLRPDMIYHDPFPFEEFARKLQQHGEKLLITPDWALYNGLNDRFAIMGRAAAETYGFRLQLISDYFKQLKSPLHAERLLKFVAEKNHLRFQGNFTEIRASRVRANGAVVHESFAPQSSLLARILTRIKGKENVEKARAVKLPYGGL